MSRTAIATTVTALAAAIALTGASAGHAEPPPSSGYVEGFKFSTTLRNRATSVDGGGHQSVAGVRTPPAAGLLTGVGPAPPEPAPPAHAAGRASSRCLTVIVSWGSTLISQRTGRLTDVR
jgi:hypothetical protein